jgi:hypothetical protein
VSGCELCEAAPLTHRYHEDDLCWVADCEACDVPMVVWRQHGSSPPPDARERMLDQLTRVAAARYGADGFTVDPVMRQIPDHFHAHARPPRRFGRL